MKRCLIFFMIIILFMSGCGENNDNFKVYFKGDYLCAQYKESGYVKKAPVKNGDKYEVKSADFNGDSINEVILINSENLLIYDFSGIPIELRRNFKSNFSVYSAENNNICVVLPGGKSFSCSVKSNTNLSTSAPYDYDFYDADHQNDAEIIYKTDIKSNETTILTMTLTEKYRQGIWYLSSVTYEVK